MISAFGMFNALVMSYSRLPLAMAQDGMLPKVFGKLHPTDARPWVAIVVLRDRLGLCLGLGFERLVTIDILLYGASLMLEFVALVCAAHSRAGVAASVPRAGRHVRGDGGRSRSHAAARLFDFRSQNETVLRHEFVRLRHDPDGGGRRGLLA